MTPDPAAHVGETEPECPISPTWAELDAEDIPFDGPPPTAYADELAWRSEFDRYRDESERQADAGRHLAEREDAELESLRAGFAVAEFLTDVLPDRAARRVRAAELLGTIRRRGCLTEFRHGSVRVYPACPADLAGDVYDLDPELADILTDEH